MMETRTREKGTIDRGLQGSVGTLDDMNPTRLSKRSQGCPLTKKQWLARMMPPSQNLLRPWPNFTKTYS